MPLAEAVLPDFLYPGAVIHSTWENTKNFSPLFHEVDVERDVKVPGKFPVEGELDRCVAEGVEVFLLLGIETLQEAAELIDRCRLENQPDQKQLEAIIGQLRQLTDRLSTEAILKVADV